MPRGKVRVKRDPRIGYWDGAQFRGPVVPWPALERALEGAAHLSAASLAERTGVPLDVIEKGLEDLKIIGRANCFRWSNGDITWRSAT